MSEDVNIDEVITRRFELDEQITLLGTKHKAELAPLIEEMQLCESFVKAELLKTGAQQWKSATTGHQTFWTTKDSVTVEDMDAVIHRILSEAPIPEGFYDHDAATYTDMQAAWEKVLDHIRVTGLWGLLNKAVNKSAVKEMIEAQQQPPGVKYVSFKDLSWRRGKAGV